MARLRALGTSEAVVLHSLFEEQIEVENRALDRSLSYGTESYAEAVSYLPDLYRHNLGPDGYLEHVRRAKKALSIPVIGSLNAVSTGGWVSFARRIQEADAVELNVSCIPTDPGLSAADVEQMYVDIVRDVRARVSIPVAVKLGHGPPRTRDHRRAHGRGPRRGLDARRGCR